MADYHPLISRAVEGLSENTPDLRQAVYERARAALMQQLRSLDPPLSDADISRERRSLDLAIERVERQFGGASERAGAPLAAPMPRASRPAPAPRPAPVPPRASSLAPRPRDPAPAPARPPEEWRSPAVAAAPVDETVPAPPPVERSPPPALRGSLDQGEAPEMVPPPENGRERPRVGIVALSRGGGGHGRSIILAVVLGGVISAIALTAWLLRDKPADAPRAQVTAEAPRAPEPENKFGERVVGERPSSTPAPAPAPAPAAPAAPQTAAPAPGTPPAARPDVGIAQRAILYEENPADPQTPKAAPARVLWKLDAVNAGQGQPLETVVRATIETTEGGFTLNLLLRRNLDAALPASHTIELAFNSTAKDPNRVVRDVGKLALKNEEGQPGAPLAGLQVPVTTNLFLFGLSNVPRDIERNTELLLRRNWIDLPIMFASGQRAVLSFEKGRPGESVISEAFRQW